MTKQQIEDYARKHYGLDRCTKYDSDRFNLYSGFVDGAMWIIERDEAKAEVEHLKRVEDCSNARKAEILRLREIIDEQAAELEKLKPL